MKKNGLIFMCYISLLACFSSSHAGSNNGYTSAANVYSGSSSHSWFGGGVEYVLAKWKEEAKQAKVPETAPTPPSDVPNANAEPEAATQ